jgi:Zn finger protein HypA/HybF involved in hydrogenase expression
MPNKEYECKDCGRAFRVEEEEKKERKCPGCESENTALKPAGTLPLWALPEPTTGSS